MKSFWAVGHPFDTCYTTPVLNGIFRELSLDAKMETHEVSAEDFPAVIEKLKSGEIDGLIVSSPHKKPALEYADVISLTAEKAGALNMLLNRDGKLSAHNTNGHGALRIVRNIVPDFEEKKVLIVGAGGAARAAAWKLKKHGVDVAIWNRTPERAEAFAQSIDIEFVEDMRKWEEKPHIIINATSVSSQSKQKSLIPYTLWKNCELAIDAVYKGMSLFLEEAQAAGVEQVFSGDEWMAEQMVEAIDRMFGIEIQAEQAMRILNSVEPC